LAKFYRKNHLIMIKRENLKHDAFVNDKTEIFK